MKTPTLRLSILSLLLCACPLADCAELEVFNGSELALVLSGGEWQGNILDDGSVIVLGGEDEVFIMDAPPEPYYKGFDFTVRTSAARPADKHQVTLRYTGEEKAEVFSMTSGKVTLSNVMLDGWSLEPCCPAY